jgi:uncharacterized protein (UPF0332 family)
MMERDAEIYLAKAAESLLTAESEFDHGRYNSCANRCYDACSQAAIAAMLSESIRSSNNQWPHTFVQSVFVGQLVNRRHRYPSTLRDTLGELQLLRQRADYETDWITRAEANRGLRRCREFVATIQQSGGERR